MQIPITCITFWQFFKSFLRASTFSLLLYMLWNGEYTYMDIYFFQASCNFCYKSYSVDTQITIYHNPNSCNLIFVSIRHWRRTMIIVFNSVKSKDIDSCFVLINYHYWKYKKSNVTWTCLALLNLRAWHIFLVWFICGGVFSN